MNESKRDKEVEKAISALSKKGYSITKENDEIVVMSKRHGVNTSVATIEKEDANVNGMTIKDFLKMKKEETIVDIAETYLNENRNGYWSCTFESTKGEFKYLVQGCNRKTALEKLSKMRPETKLMELVSITYGKPELSEEDRLESIVVESYLDEVLSKAGRKAISRAMKKNSKKIQRKKEIAAKKKKDPEKLKNIAKKQAVNMIKKKLTKGKENLSPAEMERVEAKIKKMGAKIAKLAKKLLPGIKEKEKERLAKMRGGEEDSGSE
jgi:hypothetical protein